MTINLSNGLAALSMLSNTNSFTSVGTVPDFETRAVRLAKKQFTLAATTPPWKETASTTPESSQISAIKRLTTIIDKTSTTGTAGSADVQTTFTAYKALAKLQLLATAAARTTTSSAERASLQATFAKGMADLQTFLGQAASDDVNLSFALPTRRAETVAATATSPVKFTGTGILETRTEALPGMTGNEIFQVTLSKAGGSDVVTVDLSQTPQPPTLDSVSDAINAAITAIPKRNADGSLALDADGNEQPAWLARFVADKSSGKWGFSVNAPNGAERVSIDQIGAGDALVVATGQTAVDAVVGTQVLRFDDATGEMTRTPLATIAAVDSEATAQAQLVPVTPVKGVTAVPVVVKATTTAQAIATDAAGFSYVVGTTSGDIGANVSSGSSDLFLTKLDSEGGVVWQRSLGASSAAQGAAISISSNGDITVAGTVSGTFDGSSSDGDMLVARYDAQGDEKFATIIQSTGADTASAIAVAADGTIFVGGKTTNASGTSGNAFLVRVDTSGRVNDRRTIDAGGSESITALAIGQDGNVLALTNESGEAHLHSISAASLSTDLGDLTLGRADARAIAVAADGTIAVAGATTAALDGAQANAMGGGRDGFVTRIDAALTSASTSYIATGEDDQVDSVTFMNGALYVGGRTTGALDGAKVGSVDGFVGRIDAASGAIENVSQFGQIALRTEPVRIAAATGGDTVLGALGLHRGELNTDNSVKLVAQTGLRAGDEFSLSVNGKAARKITILADDTMATLAVRVRAITGSNATVTSTTVSGKTVLRIDAKTGTSIALVAGGKGKDALAKLGLDPARLSVPAVVASGAPKVQPGGTYGLALTDKLNLTTAKDATATLAALKTAISTTQTAYRSLYWDDAKATLTNGSTTTAAFTALQAAQLASYQAALARLTPVDETTTTFSAASLLGL